jgi:hypothetical protein
VCEANGGKFIGSEKPAAAAGGGLGGGLMRKLGRGPGT